MSTTINGQTAEALGIANLRARHANLADGALTFTAPARDVDASYLFDYLQPVTLVIDGVIRWQGPVIGRSAAGSPGAENHSYTVASPWWYLEHVTLLDPWKVKAGKDEVYLARVIMGLSANGVTRMTAGQQLAAILGYVAGCSMPTSGTVPISTGAINISSPFPVTEIKGLSAAEALRKVLAWAPDAVAWWSYGLGRNLLNVKRRGDLAEVTLVSGTAPIESIDIRPREALVPSEVVIAFEKTDVVNDKEQLQVTFDAAPDGANGRRLGALNYTVNLQGSRTATIEQRLKVQKVPLDKSSLTEARRYWGARLGLLEVAATVTGDALTPEITFLGNTPGGTDYFTRKLSSPDGYDGSGAYEWEDAEKKTGKVRLNEDLTRELIEGSVMPWMSGVRAQEQIITVNISYRRKGGSTFSFTEQRSLNVMMTDATSGVKVHVDSAIEGEAPTYGLAAQMLAALAAPHYEGTIVLLADEVPVRPALGNVLNVGGLRGEWATMDAVIQQVDENFETGHKTLTLGPPEHLGPQDIIALQRAEREPDTRNKSENAKRRKSGIA